MKHLLLSNYLKFTITTLGLGMLAACHSGTNTGTTSSNSNQPNSLATYFSSNNKQSIRNKNMQLQSSSGNQPSYFTSSTTAIASMTITWYSDLNCSTKINGGSFTFEGPYITTAGDTYYIPDEANYYACENGYPGGCSQMYIDGTSKLLNSAQFTFNYVGGGSFQGQCMYGTGASGGINSIAVSINNDIYAGTSTSNSVYVTESNTTWSQVGKDSMPDSGNVNAIAISHLGNNVYAGTDMSDVYISESGAAWALLGGKSLPDQGEVLSLASDSSNNVYAGSRNGDVYISNNGKTWALFGGESLPDEGGVNSIAIASSGNIYAGSGGSDVFISESGAKWALVGGDSLPDNGGVNSVALDSSENVYAGTTVGNVYTSTSRLTSWKQIGGSGMPDGGSVNSITTDQSGNIYAGSKHGDVYVSTSTGVWTLVGNRSLPDGGSVNSVVLDSSHNIYAGSSNGHVYISVLWGEWTTVGSVNNLGDNGGGFFANYANNGACTSGSACGFSQAYPTIQLPATAPTKYIFMTANLYDGNLLNGGGTGSAYPNIPASSGASGADAICQYEADNNAGTLLPPGGTYKALLIDSTRYPCNENGVCEGSGALNWPVHANTGYLTPTIGGTATAILSSNGNGVFETTFTAGLIATPNGSVNNSYFWTGINGILTGKIINNTAQIVGWSYANNSASWNSGSWEHYSDQTCNSWTSNDSIAYGYTGNNANLPSSNFGITGLKPSSGYSSSDAWLNDNPAFVSRWIAGSSNNSQLTYYTCNNRAALICVMQ